MNSNEVMHLVRRQIAGRSSLPNSHGVVLGNCLVRPTRIKVINRIVQEGKIRDSVETVWLVLEENPHEKDGYKVVFSEQQGMFGLASVGFETDQHPVLCGFYGDFPTTLSSM